MLWVIIGIIILIILFFGVLLIRVIVAGRAVQGKIEGEVHQVIMDISHGGFYEEKLKSLAQRLDTRSHLYRRLCSENKDWEGLFPDEYKNIERIAESDLAVWLLHPNELNAIPDEIRLIKVIEKKEDSGSISQFIVFKFRTLEPHWASKKGWIAGIAGPYALGEDPLYSPACVFSRFEGFDTRTPDEHCEITIQTVLGK